MSQNTANMQGLYMISGIEDLTGNVMLDFYSNNKLLVWGTGLAITGLIIHSFSKKKTKKK
jgi:hypothetical protein